MKLQHVFHGRARRVQLTVIDLTGPEVTATIREASPGFGVASLVHDAHPSTAYAKGQHHYWGSSFDDAWDIVKRFVPSARPPAKFDRYWRDPVARRAGGVFPGWSLTQLQEHRSKLVDGIEWTVWNEKQGYSVEHSSEELKGQLRNLDARVKALQLEAQHQ